MTNIIKIGQLNLHNNKHATLELENIVVEYNLDVVLIQEQYQCSTIRSQVVQFDNKSLAGIYIPRSKFTFTALTNLMTTHCAVAELSCEHFKIYIISFYLQYADPADVYLHHLSNVLRSLNGYKIIMGGDVNASSALWFGNTRAHDTQRRVAVEDFIAQFNLNIHNTPDAPPTYSSPSGESSIDVTLSSAYVHIQNWHVLPDASCSDHRLILYECSFITPQGSSESRTNYRYKNRSADWDFFSNLFASHSKDFVRSDLSVSECAELMTETFVYCADVAIGRESVPNIRRCDWWNDRLVGIRRKFRAARRKLKKVRRACNSDVGDERYVSALSLLRVTRSHYRAAVLQAKGNLVKSVVEKLEKEGPWSPLYHEFKANRPANLAFISNLKIGDNHTTGLEDTTDALLKALIPDDSHENDSDYHREVRRFAADIPPSPVSDLPSADEFVTVVRSLSTNKASGEDKISNRMIKEACKTAGPHILKIMNRCIAEGTFPAIWRQGYIKIIPKPGDKPANDPKSYRPITLLSSLGKLLERLIVPRLVPGGISFHDCQYGFTAGKSTIDAIISVRQSVESSESHYVLAVFLDISGAFDNAWWPIILLKLKARGCPSNIYSLIASYFINGSTKLQLGHYDSCKRLTKGCPQGSVLSPYLWNLGFDDLFTLPLPSGSSLTGYADDGLLLIHGNSVREIEALANTCLSLIYEWGDRNRLSFAPSKTFQLLLKGSLVCPPRLRFNQSTIKRKDSVSYLGLLLERNFSFVDHIIQVCEKAKRNFFALNRISTSTWGLGFKNLKIIYGATYVGCLCYGAPVWVDRAMIVTARRKLLQSQRCALIFLCKAYRTVSTDALPVLAGVLPIDLEIQRRAATYYESRNIKTPYFVGPRSRPNLSKLMKCPSEVYEDLLNEWQIRWDNSSKGRHLFQFFPSIRDRLAKKWLEIDHCVAQFLSGHGNFKSKLHSFTLVPSPYCECSSSDNLYEQTAHHILWECDLWQHERHLMLDSIYCNSGVVYYQDLVATIGNFKAFKRFCHNYYWQHNTRHNFTI